MSENSNLRFIMYFVMFMLVSVALITFMPPELYISGYQGKEVYFPDDDVFDIWSVVPKEEAISGQLASGTILELDIPDTTQKAELVWNVLFSNQILVYHYKSENKYSFNREQLLPIVYKTNLLDNWEDAENGSFIVFTRYSASMDIEFEDWNGSRNDISLAWDDGLLNCTLYASADLSDTNQYIGAREIIFALVTFRLPSIYATINPLFGFIMSIFFFIPLAFISFTVILWIIHGMG